jgi:hypothetical protein
MKTATAAAARWLRVTAIFVQAAPLPASWGVVVVGGGGWIDGVVVVSTEVRGLREQPSRTHPYPCTHNTNTTSLYMRACCIYSKIAIDSVYMVT